MRCVVGVVVVVVAVVVGRRVLLVDGRCERVKAMMYSTTESYSRAS